MSQPYTWRAAQTGTLEQFCQSMYHVSGSQLDQCVTEQYYVRSSMLRALIYNQARPGASTCAPLKQQLHSCH